jgi:Bacterial regulatory protein, Fis family
MPGERTKLSDLEREHILATLRRCRGNRTRAAKSLGISVRGLRIKLAAYAEMGVEVPPAAHRDSGCVIAATRLPSKTNPSAGRAEGRPSLDAHVRKQLGLSLRIFYDGIFCVPLPEKLVELAHKSLPSRPAG